MDAIPEKSICNLCGENVKKGIHIYVDNEFGESCIDVQKLAEIMKAHGLHESFCSVFKAQVHNSRGQTYMHPGECTCWLSKGV